MDKKTTAVNQNEKVGQSIENQIQKSVNANKNAIVRNNRAEFYKKKYEGTAINKKKK
jgi:hypothetical protein